MSAAASGRRIEPGDMLGSWCVVRSIGAGGMGEVFAAEHNYLPGRKAALKVLKQKRAASSDFAARFRAEAALHATIDHPNVVRFYDAGVTDGGLAWMAMELLSGQALSDILLEQGTVSLPDTLQILSEIADGVHAAHLVGVVHRDLKPSNVFVTERQQVKVLDLGTSKLLGGDPKLRAIRPSTAHNVVIGTYAFMSPEQILGKAVDYRSDIFPLAIMGYLMLSGRHPFAGEEAARPDVMGYRTVLTEPAPLDDLPGGCPADVWTLLASMFAKNREERPQSMAKLAEQLRALRRRYLDSQGLPAAPLDSIGRSHAGGSSGVMERRAGAADEQIVTAVAASGSEPELAAGDREPAAAVGSESVASALRLLESTQPIGVIAANSVAGSDVVTAEPPRAVEGRGELPRVAADRHPLALAERARPDSSIPAQQVQVAHVANTEARSEQLAREQARERASSDARREALRKRRERTGALREQSKSARSRTMVPGLGGWLRRRWPELAVGAVACLVLAAVALIGMRLVGGGTVSVSSDRAATTAQSTATSLQVGHNLEETVVGSRRSFVQGSRVDATAGDHDDRVSGHRITHIEGREVLNVDGAATLQYSKDVTTKVAGSKTVVVGRHEANRSFDLHVEGTAQLHGTRRIEVSSDQELVLRCGDASIRLTADRIELDAPTVTITGPSSGLQVSEEGVKLRSATVVAQLLEELLVMRTEAGASLSLGCEARLDGVKILLNSPSRAEDELPEDPGVATVIELCDQLGQPLANQRYVIAMGDGSELSGRLDERGRAEVDLPAAGTITFPELSGVQAG